MMQFPKLKIVVGIPGSGKTTWCLNEIKKYKLEKTVHISSDSIRKELTGDENDQSVNNEVFTLMQKRTIEYLEKGYNVLYDATNIKRKDRAEILSKVPSYVTKEAIICWAPIELCIKRDQERERTVGKAVIDRMLRNFQAPYFDEGFDRIYIEYPEYWEDINNNNDKTKYVNHILNENISQDNPHHSLNLQEHMIEARKYIMLKYINEYELLWATRLHDVGKLYTKSFKNTKGEVTTTAHYYGHQGYSSWICYGFNLANNNTIAWLISSHMDPYFNTKYYRNLPEFLKVKIDILHEADKNAH